MSRPDTIRIPKPTEIMPLTEDSLRLCAEWEKQVKYVPNPKHKLYPGRYNMPVPPYSRTIDSLCEKELPDLVLSESMKLLHEVFRRCMVSVKRKDGCPSRVWAVALNSEGEQIVCEARYERRDNDTGKIVYHGFPYQPSKDSFYKKII
ncbi:MAG: hypothetical protein RR808_09100 [Akkermansia sp.]